MKRIRQILIEKDVAALDYTREILSHFPSIPKTIVDNTRDLHAALSQTKNPISEGKKVLVLERNEGAFLKPFPGTKNYLYCGHYVLNFATQCDLECSYCILQPYLNNPAMRIFVNLDAMFRELETTVDANPRRFFRISTGVFTDSLSLERITGFHEKILPFFLSRDNVVLELKSKAGHVDFARRISGNGRVMFSFSLNSERIQQEEEKLTHSIEQRLLAAKTCVENGFRVSFHFDPIIHYPGWEKDYKRTISMLFEHISPDKITWISLGCLRFMPELKEIVAARHPRSAILQGEFIKGLDGKMRYPKPLRVAIYRKMAEMLEFSKHKFRLYLCMESDSIWKRSLGFSPESREDLADYLHSSFCPTSAKWGHLPTTPFI